MYLGYTYIDSNTISMIVLLAAVLLLAFWFMKKRKSKTVMCTFIDPTTRRTVTKKLPQEEDGTVVWKGGYYTPDSTVQHSTINGMPHYFFTESNPVPHDLSNRTPKKGEQTARAIRMTTQAKERTLGAITRGITEYDAVAKKKDMILIIMLGASCLFSLIGLIVNIQTSTQTAEALAIIKLR
jgi:hypothetical protein